MRFSLIMATLNRCTEVARFLAHMIEQSFADFELIIVDQNQDGILDTVISEYSKLINIQHHKVAFTGVSKARNFGLSQAKGEIISFPDDDCWYKENNVLEKINALFHADASLDGVSTLVELHTSMRWRANTTIIDKKNIFSTVIEYNFFIKKSLIDKIGAFNERLGLKADSIYGSGEGTDLILRALTAGGKLLYSSSVRIYHNDKLEKFSSAMRSKGFSYGCGLGYVLYKYNFPLMYKLQVLIRPLGATILCLSNINKALYYWNIFKGRLKGLVSARNANI